MLFVFLDIEHSKEEYKKYGLKFFKPNNNTTGQKGTLFYYYILREKHIIDIKTVVYDKAKFKKII